MKSVSKFLKVGTSTYRDPKCLTFGQVSCCGGKPDHDYCDYHLGDCDDDDDDGFLVVEENLWGKLHLVNIATSQKIFHSSVLLAPHLRIFNLQYDDDGGYYRVFFLTGAPLKS